MNPDKEGEGFTPLLYRDSLSIAFENLKKEDIL